MQNEKVVEHKGVVLERTLDVVKVELIEASHCEGCHVKGSCMVAEHDHKVVDVEDKKGHFSVGDTVKISMGEGKGFKAVFLGYVIPFFILVSVLIATYSLKQNEEMAGIVAIACLIPYYFFLFLIRDKLTEEFQIKVKKLYSK